MALYKYHYIELDTKRSPRISLQNIVAGETGNRIWVTVTNNGETIDMSEKEDGEFIYRVALRIDSDLGTRRQDSAQENSGITFIEAATGDHGKINILLSKDSFTAGMNRARIEIFSKRAEDNDTLIISAEWTFRAAGNPTGENAGSVYPSLIELENELNQLIDDAEDAIEDCEDATEAANDATDAANAAAETLNNMIENIDDEPTQNSNNLVKSGGVYSFVTDKVQEAADDLRAQIPEGASSATAEKPKMDGTAYAGVSTKWARADHVHPHDTSKQDVLTFDNMPTSGSNNPVKSGGIYTALAGKQNTLTFDNAPTSGSNNPVKSGGIKTAIDAAKNAYLYRVLYAASTWSGTNYFTTTTDTNTALAAIAATGARFMTSVAINGAEYTLYEIYRSGDDIFLASDKYDDHYVSGYINLDTNPCEISFRYRVDEDPMMIHVDSTEEVQGTGGQTYRVVHLATGAADMIYAQRNKRELQMHLPVWGRLAGTTLDMLLRKAYVYTTDSTCEVTFTSGLISVRSADAVEERTISGIEEYSVRVFYVNGVFNSAVATHYSKTF